LVSAHQAENLRQGHDAFLIVGDVYRRDEIDTTHYPVFHQIEGVKVFSESELPNTLSEEKQLQIAEQDLKKNLERLVTSIFGNVKMRWVDAYFPFTVPSWEMEIFWQDKWLEVLGCGLVHPQIMKNCNIGHKRGWAFGLGLERLALVLFEIPDIRLFWSEDPRFSNQFTSDNIVKFQPFSKYPPCIKDITFWLPKSYHQNDLYEFVRSVGKDLIESVELLDKFIHPKTARESHCYRITYRSMERNLTNDEINVIQEQIRRGVVSKLGVELR
jgi:phenylalanyl-tRNA synthetase alpha chain